MYQWILNVNMTLMMIASSIAGCTVNAQEFQIPGTTAIGVRIVMVSVHAAVS